MDLGEKTRRLRVDYKESAASLGRALGRSPSTINLIEDGETKDPKLSIARGIAERYGVSLGWLADDSADWPPPAVSFEDKAQKEFLAALERVGQHPPEDAQTAELLASCRLLDPTAAAHLIGIARGMALGQGEPTAADSAAADRRRYAKQAGAELEADGQRALGKRAKAKRKGKRGAG